MHQMTRTSRRLLLLLTIALVGTLAGTAPGEAAAGTHARVAQASGAERLGQSLLEPAWRRVRPGWVRSLQSATSVGQVARLLAQLEAHTKWSAVYPWWSKRRTIWSGKLGAL